MTNFKSKNYPYVNYLVHLSGNYTGSSFYELLQSKFGTLCNNQKKAEKDERHLDTEKSPIFFKLLSSSLLFSQALLYSCLSALYLWFYLRSCQSYTVANTLIDRKTIIQFGPLQVVGSLWVGEQSEDCFSKRELFSRKHLSLDHPSVSIVVQIFNSFLPLTFDPSRFFL